jgi:hypothetical protein
MRLGRLLETDLPGIWPAKNEEPIERARGEHRDGSRWLQILRALPVLLALVLWRLSLRHVSIDHLGDYGLPPVLPPAWYAALTVCTLGAVATLCTPHPRGWLVALYVGAVIAILFATVPVLSEVPHYSWSYKHFGVTSYLELHGATNINVDIYNRWPGFFAFSALFSVVAGHADPEGYAKWFELFSITLDAALIVVAVRTICLDTRIAGGAALFFVLGNWVGQNYYSPQAFGFLMGLGLTAIVLRHLRRDFPSRLNIRIISLTERLSRRTQVEPLVPPHPWRSPIAITVVLAMDMVIIPSHQLTPYILIIGIGGLALLGFLRSRWVVLAMAAMTFLYLGHNFTFVQHNFGLFTSLDPLTNSQHSSLYDIAPKAGKEFNGNAGVMLSLFVWVLAALSVVRLARRGLAWRAMPFIILAMAPFVVVFGQSYGGEASLRVILFSLPWCGALCVWAWSTIRIRWAQVVAAGASAAIMLSLFVPAFFGAEELNLIPGGEAKASRYFYAHAKPGSVLMLSGPNFPIRYGSRYNLFGGPKSDDDPNLLRTDLLRHRELARRDLVDVIALIRQYSSHGYLVFAKTSTQYANVFRLTPPGALRDLERAVRSSPQFRLWYRNDTTRIYELTDHSPISKPHPE